MWFLGRALSLAVAIDEDESPANGEGALPDVRVLWQPNSVSVKRREPVGVFTGDVRMSRLTFTGFPFCSWPTLYSGTILRPRGEAREYEQHQRYNYG